MPDSKVSATEFKATCLSLIDRVRERGETVTITKHGRVVARLVAAGDEDDRPWLRLRALGPGQWHGDPFAPVVDESEVEVLKPERPTRPPTARPRRRA